MTSRRVFLKSSGLALVSFGVAPRFLQRVVQASEAGRRGKVLVVVFQRGACDGLNTVVPYGERDYRALRPTIAIPAPRGGSTGEALEVRLAAGRDRAPARDAEDFGPVSPCDGAVVINATLPLGPLSKGSHEVV